MEQKTLKQQATEKYKRDENGLLESIDYVFNEDGSVNWREMIPEEFLFPNKDLFVRRGKPIPDSIEDLKDYELCIKLGGIRHLAKVRGMKKCNFTHPRLNDGYVVSNCVIEWIGNYETEGQITVSSDSANATVENCKDFGLKFLETIANNRAFVRAVRGYLNINIVGEDELGKSEKGVGMNDEPDELNNPNSPISKLSTALKARGIITKKDFKKFYSFLLKEGHLKPCGKTIKAPQDLIKQDILDLLPIVKYLVYNPDSIEPAEPSNEAESGISTNEDTYDESRE